MQIPHMCICNYRMCTYAEMQYVHMPDWARQHAGQCMMAAAACKSQSPALVHCLQHGKRNKGRKSPAALKNMKKTKKSLKKAHSAIDTFFIRIYILSHRRKTVCSSRSCGSLTWLVKENKDKSYMSAKRKSSGSFIGWPENQSLKYWLGQETLWGNL